MGIFKKTVKYSKPSKDLENKIKNLDEELKQTGVIGNVSRSNFNIVNDTRPGWLTGRRPAKGQMFPRGVYNK